MIHSITGLIVVIVGVMSAAHAASAAAPTASSAPHALSATDAAIAADPAQGFIDAGGYRGWLANDRAAIFGGLPVLRDAVLRDAERNRAEMTLSGHDHVTAMVQLTHIQMGKPSYGLPQSPEWGWRTYDHPGLPAEVEFLNRPDGTPVLVIWGTPVNAR